MINFVFFEMVCLVWKTRSRFVQSFKKVNGCDYSQLFSTLQWNYTHRCDMGISNKSCFGQIFVIPKIVKSREIANIQKVFEWTAVLVEIFLFFTCENQIETPLLSHYKIHDTHPLLKNDISFHFLSFHFISTAETLHFISFHVTNFIVEMFVVYNENDNL